ncbi:MAG TPA: hypothetical protein P5509_07430 [Bacteroidales bacterium]|nr:hypothetical protein [Bacteroidales bacterium]
MGIKKVVKTINWHGGLVYIWDIKTDHLARAQGVGYLNGWWGLGYWKPNGDNALGTKGETWDNISFKRIEKFEKDMKDNAFIDTSNWDNKDTQKISQMFNPMYSKGPVGYPEK